MIKDINNNEKKWVIARNVQPVRSATTNDSEQINQILMGSPVYPIREMNSWVEIRHWDQSEGWVPEWTVVEAKDDCGYEKVEVKALFAEVYKEPYIRSEIMTKLTVSVQISKINDAGIFAECKLPANKIGYIKNNYLKKTDMPTGKLPKVNNLLKTAYRFIGTPYLWGGTSSFGLDCSGFVQLIYKLNGVYLLRNSNCQRNDARCKPIERRDIKTGDLVFFGENINCASHVGMAIDKNTFIHSCGSHGVIISELDEPRYAKIYLGAGRMLRTDYDSVPQPMRS